MRFIICNFKSGVYVAFYEHITINITFIIHQSVRTCGLSRSQPCIISSPPLFRKAQGSLPARKVAKHVFRYFMWIHKLYIFYTDIGMLYIYIYIYIYLTVSSGEGNTMRNFIICVGVLSNF